MPNATIPPEKRLFLKDRELGALLEITQAINLDYAEGELYKIFQFTLLGQLNIRRLVLYVKEEGEWECVVSFGPGLPDFRRISLPEDVVGLCMGQPRTVAGLVLSQDWELLETVI